MTNPFDYTPDPACAEAFRNLLESLETLRESDRPEDRDLWCELQAGKMLGVLIAEDNAGLRHTLYAFSGQLGESGFHHPLFVGPVFDYLDPSGHFKIKEADISRRNSEISRFESGPLAKARFDFEREERNLQTEISEYRNQCRLAKLERQRRRESGEADSEALAAMIRQSQFEKAELHRMKKRMQTRLTPFAALLEEIQGQLKEMKAQRHAESEALQDWLFSNFRLLNALGESWSLSEIFAQTSLRIPPSGAGECCAPKLLQAAYLRGLHPVAMAEYWYGPPKGGEVRIHGRHYPACRGKCLPVLRWMLQGLDIQPPLDSDISVTLTQEPRILYENEWFCVVDKPAGMLSVPGKGAALSVQDWLAGRYGTDRSVRMAHRLDRDTSGLIVAAFDNEALRTLQALFATRKVQKTYVALLEGDYKAKDLPEQGRIALPLSPDLLDRPRQRVNPLSGKEAVTEYRFIGTEGGRSRVEFHPLTGRTHQLRLHAASQDGLGLPIAGDALYGTEQPAPRLYLHALSLEFTFPLDGRRYSFESPVPF